MSIVCGVRVSYLLACALCAFADVVAAQSTAPSCFRYEPDTVRLTGVLEKHTYPGRPNYESTKAGDEAETGYYLALAESICTIGGGASRENEPHDGVRRVQLVIRSGVSAELSARVGRRVTLRGTLFSSFTGHHRTPILITVLSPVVPVDDARRLLKIRRWVAATTRELQGDRIVKRDLSGFSSESGELTTYSAADTVRKMDAQLYGETGRAREEYFTNDGQPYFALITDDRYDHSGRRNVVHTYQTRLYFDDDRLISWIDSTGRRRAPTGAAAEEQAREALLSFRGLQRCASAAASGDACEASDSASR